MGRFYSGGTLNLMSTNSVPPTDGPPCRMEDGRDLERSRTVTGWSRNSVGMKARMLFVSANFITLHWTFDRERRSSSTRKSRQHGKARLASPPPHLQPLLPHVQMIGEYRVSHTIMQRGFLEKFLGLPPACGPLLQLATAQAGQGNSQNKT